MRHVVVGLAAVGAALIAVQIGAAKGASEATIIGPGLDEPLALVGEGDTSGALLSAFAEQAGFFFAVFAQTPDPMRDSRPPGELGPKYTVSYVMPGPNNEVDTLTQDVYPYASPSPVTYVRPGQSYWTTRETRGGWFVASPRLRELLVSAGLPESAPVAGGGESESPWRVVVPIAAILAIGATAITAAALVARRRPQAA